MVIFLAHQKNSAEKWTLKNKLIDKKPFMRLSRYMKRVEDFKTFLLWAVFYATAVENTSMQRNFYW